MATFIHLRLKSQTGWEKAITEFPGVLKGRDFMLLLFDLENRFEGSGITDTVEGRTEWAFERGKNET